MSFTADVLQNTANALHNVGINTPELGLTENAGGTGSGVPITYKLPDSGQVVSFNSKPTGNFSSNIASMQYRSSADRTDLMYFGADGYRASNGSSSGGNLVNVNGVAHYGWVWKDATNVKTGTYTGTGSAQTITTGFQPLFINIHSASAREPVQQYASQMAGGSTNAWDSAQTTGKVSSTSSTGFTLGTDANVNANAETYWYTAIGSYIPTITATSSTALLMGI